VNLLSNYHTVQTFLPGMLSRPGGGTIVTISSVLGYLGCASLCACFFLVTCFIHTPVEMAFHTTLHMHANKTHSQRITHPAKPP